MKKFGLLIISTIILILSFITMWYSDNLFGIYGLVWLLAYPVLAVIVFTIYIVLIIKLIHKMKEKVNITNIVTAMLLIIIPTLVCIFPFRELKVKSDFNKYERARLEVIQMVKENRLVPDEFGNVSIPEKYKMLTNDTEREIYVFQNDENGQVIGFWIARGMMSPSFVLVYSSGDEELIRHNNIDTLSIKKLDDNWYYIVTK